MADLISGEVYRNKDVPNANELFRELKIFPTPFKGIYYVPYQSERNAWYVTDSHLVVFKAAELYLRSNNYYFGLYSSLYYHRVIWNAFGTDIINNKLSRKITHQLPSKKYWRGKIINRIMANYMFPIRFHRIKNFDLKKAREEIVTRGNILFSSIDLRADESSCYPFGHFINHEALIAGTATNPISTPEFSDYLTRATLHFPHILGTFTPASRLVTYSSDSVPVLNLDQLRARANMRP